MKVARHGRTSAATDAKSGLPARLLKHSGPSAGLASSGGYIFPAVGPTGRFCSGVSVTLGFAPPLGASSTQTPLRLDRAPAAPGTEPLSKPVGGPLPGAGIFGLSGLGIGAPSGGWER